MGSVIWNIKRTDATNLGIDTFSNPDNITDGLTVDEKIEPIQIFNYKHGEHGVSLLVFLPEFIQRNGTEVECDATKSGFDRSNVTMKDKIQVYGNFF